MYCVDLSRVLLVTLRRQQHQQPDEVVDLMSGTIESPGRRYRLKEDVTLVASHLYFTIVTHNYTTMQSTKRQQCSRYYVVLLTHGYIVERYSKRHVSLLLLLHRAKYHI